MVGPVGKPVVLFPEGTRRSGPVIEVHHDGAAFVASQAGVPIVPVGIGGSERALPKGKALPRPVKIHILIGEPLLPVPVAEGARHPSRRAVRALRRNGGVGDWDSRTWSSRSPTS